LGRFHGHLKNSKIRGKVIKKASFGPKKWLSTGKTRHNIMENTFFVRFCGTKLALLSALMRFSKILSTWVRYVLPH
jgi:hypothetical protein